MITLDNIGFNGDATSLQVVITSPVGDEYSTARLWTSENYKSETDFVNLISYFPAGAIAGQDIITIPVSAIGKTNFNGVFYIEIVTTGATGATAEFAVSNLTVYKTCILDKLLQVDIINCVPTVTTDCADLSAVNISFIDTLLEGLEYALLQSNLLAAQEIELHLNKLCTDDCGCTQTTEDTYLVGTYITGGTVTSGIYPILV